MIFGCVPTSVQGKIFATEVRAFVNLDGIQRAGKHCNLAGSDAPESMSMVRHLSAGMPSCRQAPTLVNCCLPENNSIAHHFYGDTAELSNKPDRKHPAGIAAADTTAAADTS